MMNQPIAMKLNFEQIKDSDRIWIYQADRFLSDQETSLIYESGKGFISEWNAHGSALSANIAVAHHLFVIINLDENIAMASGCSIDKLFKWILSSGVEIGVDFSNRNILSWIDSGDNIRLSQMAEFEKLILAEKIKTNTLVFNNLIYNGKDLKSRWQIPAIESWHARFFLSMKDNL